MKNNIEVNQLIKLGTEKILTLSSKAQIDTVWMEWDSPRKIQSAIDAYEQKGWLHSSLKNTAKSCNIANLLALLSEEDEVLVGNQKTEGNDQTQWSVAITSKTSREAQKFVSNELCDALWDGVCHRVFRTVN